MLNRILVLENSNTLHIFSSLNMDKIECLPHLGQDLQGLRLWHVLYLIKPISVKPNISSLPNHNMR